MANHEYSRTELFEKYAFYRDHQEQLLLNAEQRVSEWKYANELMYHPLPYEDLIDARTDKRWTLSTRQWLGEPTESCWWHGYDDSGQLLIMKHSTSGAKYILLHEDDYIDVVRYSGYPMMTRYCPNDDRIDRVYVCSFKPYQYHWEDFHYDQGVCVSSVESGAYENSEGEWVESDWKTTYRYVCDAKGLVEAYREVGYEDDGELRIYKRRGSKTPAKPQAPLLLAYTMKIQSDDEEALCEAAQADAYGFEMTVDHDDPIEKIFFASPRAAEEVLDFTDLAKVPRTSVGITDTATDVDLPTLLAQGATWVLVDASGSDASAQATAAADAGFSVMLKVDNKHELAKTLNEGSLQLSPAQQLAIATTASGFFAKRTLNALRKEATKSGFAEARILGIVHPDGASQLNPPPRKLGLDGYLLLNTTFDSAISVIDRLASHL